MPSTASESPRTASTPDCPRPARKPYAPPRLTLHGTLALTAGSEPSSPIPSDRALKVGATPADPAAILAGLVGLPLQTWSYRGERARHLGPMAQDFAAAFGLGTDDRTIHVVDATGVALAAIQGLHRLVETQTARLVALERECAALRAEVRAGSRDETPG